MAILKKSVLGDISGKIGNVVGTSWRGTAAIRSLPASVKNPRTPKQLAIRAMQREIVTKLRPFTMALRLGYRNTGRISSWNAAFKTHWNRLFRDAPQPIKKPEQVPTMDIARDLVITNGSLSFPITITPGRDTLFSLSWEEPEIGSTFENGTICFCVYNNATSLSSVFSIEADAGSASFSASSLALGTDDDDFLCYAFIYNSNDSSSATFLRV